MLISSGNRSEGFVRSSQSAENIEPVDGHNFFESLKAEFGPAIIREAGRWLRGSLQFQEGISAFLDRVKAARNAECLLSGEDQVYLRQVVALCAAYPTVEPVRQELNNRPVGLAKG